MAGKGTKRSLRALVATAVGVGGILCTAGAADGVVVSKTVSFACKAFLLNANGSLGAQAPGALGTPTVDNITLELDGPTQADAGSIFNVTSPGGTENVPATSNGVGVNEVKNIVNIIEVTGAAAIGTPVVTGGTVLNPTVDVNGNLIKITLDGSTTAPASLHPGSGAAYFPGGSTFQSPSITIPITAGAAGTTIVSNVKTFETNSVVLNGSLAAGVRECVVQGDTLLGSVNVVAALPPPPPPPEVGAPTAVNDVRETPQGTAITVDVLANDTAADADTDIDESTLTLKTNPANGTATITADSKITYTPNAGFTGRDTFQYEICSIDKPAPTTTTTTVEEEVIFEAEAAPDGFIDGKCHFANVTIDVKAPAAATATATTAAPGTTVAAAAPAAELPRTGGSSATLGLLGFMLLASGALFMSLFRRRRHAR